MRSRGATQGSHSFGRRLADRSPSFDDFAPEIEPFDFVPPALLPLDDVSLGHTDSLDGTGWYEAGRSDPDLFERPDNIDAPQMDAPQPKREMPGGIIGAVSGRRRDRMGMMKRRRLARVGRIGLVIAIVASFVAAVVTGVRSSGPARTPIAEAAAVDGSTTLFLHQRQGKLASAILFVTDGADSTAILVPPELRAQIPATGSGTLADAAPDPTITALTVTNALDVQIDSWVLADDVALDELFGQFGPLDVAVSESVEATVNGTTLSLTKGVHTLTPREAVAYLGARSDRGALGSLLRERDIWAAVFDSLGDDHGAIARALGVSRLISASNAYIATPSGVLSDIASNVDGLEFQVLPVTSVGLSETDVESFVVERRGLDALYAGLPENLILDPDRAVIEIRAATTSEVVNAAARIDPGRLRIALTPEPTSKYDETIIAYYSDVDRNVADALQRELGVGRVVRADVAPQGVAYTVILAPGAFG